MKPQKSDGGPSSYYDFLPGWVTFNDFMEHKAVHQWGGFALHLKDIGKALCRFGFKEGTTMSYDARKIIYSGLRLLIMIEGRGAAAAELRRLAADPQFADRVNMADRLFPPEPARDAAWYDDPANACKNCGASPICYHEPDCPDYTPPPVCP